MIPSRSPTISLHPPARLQSDAKRGLEQIRAIVLETVQRGPNGDGGGHGGGGGGANGSADGASASQLQAKLAEEMRANATLREEAATAKDEIARMQVRHLPTSPHISLLPWPSLTSICGVHGCSGRAGAGTGADTGSAGGARGG